MSPQSNNLYAYVQNMPTDLVDPSGLLIATPRRVCKSITPSEPGGYGVGQFCWTEWVFVNIGGGVGATPQSPVEGGSGGGGAETSNNECTISIQTSGKLPKQIKGKIWSKNNNLGPVSFDWAVTYQIAIGGRIKRIPGNVSVTQSAAYQIVNYNQGSNTLGSVNSGVEPNDHPDPEFQYYDPRTGDIGMVDGPGVYTWPGRDTSIWTQAYHADFSTSFVRNGKPLCSIQWSLHLQIVGGQIVRNEITVR